MKVSGKNILILGIIIFFAGIALDAGLHLSDTWIPIVGLGVIVIGLIMLFLEWLGVLVIKGDNKPQPGSFISNSMIGIGLVAVALVLLLVYIILKRLP